MKRNMNKLMCLAEDSDVVIQGDFNSQKGKSLQVVFERCKENPPGNQCHSKDKIDKWLRRKFIITVTN